MVGKKPAKPSRLGRPKPPRESRAPHRPVLTMRVSAEVYAQTVEAAQRSNRKITEEAGYRLEKSFVYERWLGELDKAFIEPDKIMNEAKKVAADIETGAIEARLDRAGYTRVYRRPTGWRGSLPGSIPSSGSSTTAIALFLRSCWSAPRAARWPNWRRRSPPMPRLLGASNRQESGLQASNLRMSNCERAYSRAIAGSLGDRHRQR